MMNFRGNLKATLKTMRYLIEAVIVKLALWTFALMSRKRATNSAAKLAKLVGKRVSVNQLAYNNIGKALPDLSQEEKDKVLVDMWDNLGRIVGEFIYIHKIEADNMDSFIEVSEETKQNIRDLKSQNKGGIIFSAHIGNWEIGPRIFENFGLRVATLYRPLNNPYVEEMTANLRGVEMIKKSSAGSRKIIEVIKSGGFVVIMADQKASQGEPVKFFHDDAITTTSIARIALKYDIPLVPARSIRKGQDFKFCIDVQKPLLFEKTKDLNQDVLTLTRKINCKLEEWIREYPAQWFWVHNRWKR